MQRSPLNYLYDGSFEGLLTAVAMAVKSRGTVTGVYTESDFVPTLFDRTQQIETDPDQAQRLFRYLCSLGRLPARLAANGYLSEDVEAGGYIRLLVEQCVKSGSAAADNFSCDPVRALRAIDKKVSFEAHRLNGLIRFRILKDGLQYAPIEPDHNIIGYCVNHFKERLCNRRWMLHDIRRGLALYWDCETLQPVTVARQFTEFVMRNGEVPAEEMDDMELHYQQLWRSFHKAINNPARENHTLQRQLMPERYWKYLVEMG